MWVEAKSELYGGETGECAGLGSGHLSDSDIVSFKRVNLLQGAAGLYRLVQRWILDVLCELVLIALLRDKFLQSSEFESLKVE